MRLPYERKAAGAAALDEARPALSKSMADQAKELVARLMESGRRPCETWFPNAVRVVGFFHAAESAVPCISAPDREMASSHCREVAPPAF